MAKGMTSLMGLWTQMRTQLEWMRRHNRAAALPVGFYGIDLPGSMVSLLPGLDAVIAYLAQAYPDSRSSHASGRRPPPPRRRPRSPRPPPSPLTGSSHPKAGTR
jgi:erythromycin esterase-like protein